MVAAFAQSEGFEVAGSIPSLSSATDPSSVLSDIIPMCPLNFGSHRSFTDVISRPVSFGL